MISTTKLVQLADKATTELLDKLLNTIEAQEREIVGITSYIEVSHTVPETRWLIHLVSHKPKQ